ncbi:uncharacterized protein [Cardiocondyla obscurior]|uniref:uncharacterized protein isoform X2 n=1 Tax=Cardiocondyla obscurior TaxID=286306 RepID=UPI00396584A8
MISSIVSRLVILVFGTLYPAYASYKAVRTKNVKEYVKWMMYWIVFALFTCAETFTDVFFSFWFPFYYEIKIILVLWLLSPATKGSSILYRRFVHPALIRREAEIDEALARATEQGYTAVLHLGTKGVNYATTVLMQTAIKGGGGLVQQLRKSYSLSDLTGEKEDENRNTPDARDETDMEVEPRRREHVGRRGYSPRRTQSSSNASRVEMYFSEVDVDVRQPRPRESVASLTNIRSSDDISSGYSSGEALQTQRTTSQGDSLVRTSSVGARTRVKPRSTTKKTPEDRDEDFDCTPPENVSLPFLNLNVLTPEQAVELLLLLSENKKLIGHQTVITDCIDNDGSVAENIQSAAGMEDNESSSVELSGEFVDTDPAQADMQIVQTIEVKNISTENLSISAAATKSADEINIDSSIRESDFQQSESGEQIECIDNDVKSDRTVPIVCQIPEKSEIVVDLEQITGEICQRKFAVELKQLLDDAHKAATGIMSSQEKLDAADKSREHVQEIKTGVYAGDTAGEPFVAPNTSCHDLDDNRAGKYHKRPAPKAPAGNEAVISNEEDNNDENESQNALKATLVIKTGTLRTVSNASTTKDIFLAHTPDMKKKKKKSNRTRAKESISKLLTIPKNIFHNAFHKEQNETSSKEEDSSSTYSETSRSASRSGSIVSSIVDAFPKSASKQDVNVEEIPLKPERDDNVKNSDRDVNETKAGRVTDGDKKEEAAINAEESENCKKNIEPNLSIHETPQPPSYKKKEIITDIN